MSEDIPPRRPWVEKDREEKWAVESTGYIYPCSDKAMAVREAKKGPNRDVVKIVIIRGEKQRKP